LVLASSISAEEGHCLSANTVSEFKTYLINV